VGSSKLKLSTTLPHSRTVCARAYYANLIDLDWDNVYDSTFKQTTVGCPRRHPGYSWGRFVTYFPQHAHRPPVNSQPHSSYSRSPLDSLSFSCSKGFFPVFPRFLEIFLLNHFTGLTVMNVLSKIPTLQELSITDDFHGTEAKAIESLLERLTLTSVKWGQYLSSFSSNVRIHRIGRLSF
jgi:hypothetical protein